MGIWIGYGLQIGFCFGNFCHFQWGSIKIAGINKYSRKNFEFLELRWLYILIDQLSFTEDSFTFLFKIDAFKVLASVHLIFCHKWLQHFFRTESLFSNCVSPGSTYYILLFLQVPSNGAIINLSSPGTIFCTSRNATLCQMGKNASLLRQFAMLLGKVTRKTRKDYCLIIGYIYTC